MKILTHSFLPLMALVLMSACSSAQIRDLDKMMSGAKKGLPLSNEEIGRGLKEALEVGVSKGADALAVTDGYFKSPYKILIPEEARTVINRLKGVPGFQNLEADLTERLNRAAEDAATKAKPIFVSAIRQMTLQDATSILMGEKNAATQYLVRTTSRPLYDAFQPVIRESLEKVNAVSLWESATTAYNQIPLVTRVNTRLDDHVTNKALDGMYGMIEKEERNIRENPAARATELLRKVFSRQDK
jgi:hypothetical protein